MCKVLIIPGIQKKHQESVKKFLKKASENMSSYPDNDGLGYAAITKNGKIFGEKWVKNADAWKRIKSKASDELLNEYFGEVLEKLVVNNNKKYEQFGPDLDLSNAVSVILHTRNKTTGDICIENTHPFYTINDENIPDTALIHNGSIINHDKLKKVYSTCDSETILHEYIDNTVSYYPENIKQVAKNLIGYYTSAVLSSYFTEDDSIVPIVDIFKSNKELYCGWVEEWETPVFATTSHILTMSAREAGVTIHETYEVKDGFLLRLSAITGKPIYGNKTQFTVSDKFEYHRNTSLSRYTPQTLTDDEKTKIAQTKQAFASKHSDYFSEDFFEVGNLTENEKAVLAEISKNDPDSKRILALVKMVTGDTTIN